jgi:short-subunit dehydrogenase
MNIILTGASRGIGYQIALALSKIGGHNLVLISRSKSALENLKEQCLKVAGPTTNIFIVAEDICELAFDFRQLKFDCIDILINNAGLLIAKPFAETTNDEGKQIFDVNFHAPAQLIRECSDLLKKSKSSHVVNISSIGGFQGSSKYAGLSYYSASKAALAALTECLATEFADTSVTFNCLALGAVQTEMLDEAFPGYKAPVSAKQMGEYIAEFALTGSKYYNGQILPVRLGNP